MKTTLIRYDARLVGLEPLERYIEALLVNPAWKVRTVSRGNDTVYEVYGPEKTDVSETSEKIRLQLSKRAEELHIAVPGLVDKATHDIICAQEGERIALEGPMHLLFQPFFGKSLLYVTIDLPASNDPKVDECIQQYLLLRLIWLANSMGMSFEEPPERSIIQ